LIFSTLTTGDFGELQEIHPCLPFSKEGDNLSPFSKGGLRGI